MNVPSVLSNTLHRVALMRLKATAAISPNPVPGVPSVRAMGMELSSPVGMAAGLDRYGTLAHRAHRLGLGFVETGTVTPLPEPGANRGIDALLVNLERNGWDRRDVRAPRVRLGISIARNSDTPAARAAADYAACMVAAWRYADYFTLNLGTVQTELAARPGALWTLLEDTRERHALLEQRFGRNVALVVKLRLTPHGLEQALELLPRLEQLRYAGILVTDEGGPAAPVKLRALAAALVTGGTDLISVGGIRDLRTACAHLGAGAALLQMHRALLLSGPRLVRAINAAQPAGPG
jgi:dihydroorotate dehydrogenase